MAANAARRWFLTRGVVKLKFVKLSSSSCNKWTWKDKKTCGSIAYCSNEETFLFHIAFTWSSGVTAMLFKLSLFH